MCDFQESADDFRELYIYLTGIDGMTNYFHFIIAAGGQFSYYLMKYQNLCKYSQPQGWERVNGKAKRAYNHNTAKGGGRGGSRKLLPIMMTLLRELLWGFGVGDKLFNPNDNTEEGEEELDIGNMT